MTSSSGLVRTLSRWAPFGVVLLVAAAACGPSFSDCRSHRTCAPPLVDGGEGGGTATSAGAASDDLEPGGSGGDAAQQAPSANARCSEEGVRACAFAADAHVWTCEGGRWIERACSADERCDTTQPRCEPIAAGCEDRQPGDAFCVEGTRIVCGPDLVTQDDDACSGACIDGECRAAECGDGIVQEGEACDDGNDDDSDACVRCESARCGDGFVQNDNEECDDGNEDDADTCVENCKNARCGDGYLNPSDEECDLGSSNSDTGACLVSCVEASCGDGLIWDGREECDDENEIATDGCKRCEIGPTKLAAGAESSCALFGDGSLKCWGSNAVGQLGLGDTKNRGDQPGQLGKALPPVGIKGPVTDVALGLNHACAIGGGSVYCWGSGSWGQLGYGNALSAAVPVRIEIGAGRPAALTLGQWFSCVLLEDGRVRCWGRGERGALGTGDTAHIGDDALEMGPNLLPVALPETIPSGARRISARRHRACAILESGATVCWGDDSLVPEEQAVPLSLAEELGVGGSHRCIINRQGRVECWGSGTYGQLGYESALDRTSASEPIQAVALPGDGVVDAIAAGDAFNCALMAGKVYCWGKAGPALGRADHAKEGRNLGDESGEMSSKLAPVDLGPDVQVHSLAAGFNHVCALLTTGDVKCWGRNDSGELGLGDKRARGSAASDMGANLPVVPLR